MIPRIIHQATDSHTWEELNLVAKNKRKMPDFVHFLWNSRLNQALLEKHFPQHMDEYLKFSAGVMRVDVARCLYLYEHGGIYCDTDYFFYKPLDDAFLSHRCVLGIEELENENCGGYKAGNAFMASEVGFELWPDFVDSIFYRHRQGERNIVQVGGPHALTKFIKGRKELESKITFLPPDVIYPAFTNFKLTTYRDENTIGAHLCWGSWRKKGLVQMVKSRARRVASAALA